mgnify:CR=1 FL=1
MKVFFGLLLVVNIAFAAFQWLLPYEQMFARPSSVPPAVELQLLSESDLKPVSESEVIAEVEAETRAIEEAVAAIESEIETEQIQQLTEERADTSICYTIGPIKDKARAAEISGRYSASQVATSLKSSVEKEYHGVMVYIGGHKNRAEALETARALSEHGIKDHIVVNRGDNPNILSLGVFGLKRNADRLKDEVEKLKFKVETEARYRQRTIYWLYGEQSSELETVRLLSDDDFDIGISQIPTQCLPGA